MASAEARLRLSAGDGSLLEMVGMLCDQPGRWFDDLELASATGRELVLGVADAETGVTEVLFSVRGPQPDLVRLRAIIGVGPSSVGPPNHALGRQLRFARLPPVMAVVRPV